MHDREFAAGKADPHRILPQSSSACLKAETCALDAPMCLSSRFEASQKERPDPPKSSPHCSKLSHGFTGSSKNEYNTRNMRLESDDRLLTFLLTCKQGG